MEYRIYAGKKVNLANGINHFDFECDQDDIDTAYDALAENIVLEDPTEDDLINFEDLADDDVKTMLQDAKKQGFISDYEISK